MIEGVPQWRTVDDLLQRARNEKSFSKEESTVFLQRLSKLSSKQRKQVVNVLIARPPMFPPANSVDISPAQQSENQF